jgi:2,4-dienoyl-CoA reductase-like NADH-dependent reductase (Old Yellow Enzyme family)
MTLLRRIEAFLRSTDTPATRFGREAVRDPRFVFDLRLGREPRPETEAKVRAFLAICEAQRKAR